jgi:hypothetical protein
MMPLQAAWAAASAYCGQAEQQTTQHPGHHGHQADGASSDTSEPPADKGDEADCDLCHHFAASALPSSQPDLPLPKGTPHLRGDLRRYVSHIPDLIPPPDRPIRL